VKDREVDEVLVRYTEFDERDVLYRSVSGLFFHFSCFWLDLLVL
jgi:hypothetical protein